MLALCVWCLLLPEFVQAQNRQPPYWASLSVSKARMRAGPRTDFPANWIYQRKGLPVKVIKVHKNWRQIEDPDGTQGWMHVRLLSATTTAIVRSESGMMYRDRDTGSALLYRAERGVVGEVSDCEDGWCMLNVGGRRGFISAESLWGGTP